jgi:hypothetical protein
MPGMKRHWLGMLLKLKGKADPDVTQPVDFAANLPFLPLSNRRGHVE